MHPTFETELVALINSYSIENKSDTADYVLAEYVMNCLDAFAVATRARDRQGNKYPAAQMEK